MVTLTFKNMWSATKSEFLTAVQMMSQVLWDVMYCWLVNSNNANGNHLPVNTTQHLTNF